MLLCQFLSKKNESPLKGIDTHGDPSIGADIFPSLRHGLAPIDVVKNNYRIVMHVCQKRMEVAYGAFSIVVPIDKDQVVFFFGVRWQKFLKGLLMDFYIG